MPSFSPELEKTLHRALTLANERNHEYSTLEHLLLALTDDEEAKEVMLACDVSIKELKNTVLAYIDEELSELVRQIPDDSKPTAGFQRVIQRAVIHIQAQKEEIVRSSSVLVAIFAERESHAAYFLLEQKMTRYDAVNYITHKLKKTRDPCLI